MKVVVERESFLAAFQMAAAVAPNRSPRAILENVKLEVTDAGSILVATDTEVGIRAVVPGVEASTTGVVVLPCPRLSSLVCSAVLDMVLSALVRN